MLGFTIVLSQTKSTPPEGFWTSSPESVSTQLGLLFNFLEYEKILMKDLEPDELTEIILPLQYDVHAQDADIPNSFTLRFTTLDGNA